MQVPFDRCTRYIDFFLGWPIVQLYFTTLSNLFGSFLGKLCLCLGIGCSQGDQTRFRTNLQFSKSGWGLAIDQLELRLNQGSVAELDYCRG